MNKQCPYKNTKSSTDPNLTYEALNSEKSKDTFTDNPHITTECPFSNKTIKTTPNETKTKGNQVEDNSDSEDENKQQGGCPVINKVKKDPVNKHFAPTYEIPYYGPFDFVFELCGNSNAEEFAAKTKKLKSYPRHLKYTLFSHSDEYLKKIRGKEFPMVFFIYDDVKEKGNKLMKKKKIKEAIKHYIFAYSTLKWLEFKDSVRNTSFLGTPSLDAVLDDDITEHSANIDNIEVEQDSYKACIVFCLLCLSYAYMELRHYSEAIECLNEALTYAGDKIPDIYFRRAQARACNKYSNDKAYQLALDDINKAITLKTDPIYNQLLDKINCTIETKKHTEMNLILSLISKAKYSYDKAIEKNFNVENFMFNNPSDQILQFKVLNEMRLKYHSAVKFFTESNNEVQIALSYKEIESFMTLFDNFLSYYKFNIANISDKYYEKLSEEYKIIITKEEVVKLINSYKLKEADNVFSEGKYNIELYKYALDYVFEKDAKEKELAEMKITAQQPKIGFWQSIISTKFSMLLTIGLIIFSLSLIGVHYKLYSSNFPLTR